MKKQIKFMAATILSFSVMMSGLSMADQANYGATGASESSDYSLDQMLIYAIQDEYLARAEYEAIMDSYSVQNPFSNIMKAEETHITLLTPLFEAYDVVIPEDTSANYTSIPETLAETFAVGVEAEIKNIEMYRSFLETELPADVRAVFERLMKASESHLKAFERGSSRGTNSRVVGNDNVTSTRTRNINRNENNSRKTFNDNTCLLN